MLLVFQICFFVGIGLILLSLILGNLFDGFGVDGLHIDLDAFDLDFMLPFRPNCIILFCLVFGGSGWLQLRGGERALWTVILIAVLLGIAVAFVVNALVFRPLRRAQNTSAPEREELLGLEAKVTEAIPADGFGEITYVFAGNTFTSPARAEAALTIKAGAQVCIREIQEHVFFVEPVEEL